ncbi:unnamed protein product [Didymodactylos carnosus]|uniref:dihydrolipoyl dehydrogenase n=1 Tax=Didymodactylos carnosus TaxID=1234261 RepID=A0A813UAA1_9BILA|nr:unnamed protein product [Didymodactylos carnosus]CAF0823462.1 unnamed protein product [Didymodactylos carnosus]CAF3607400.1 unnamed protein product [Didymodactylos carnosus]CAF3610077.1 unnamed protein product [Didymodactylos carnosus]
MSESDLKRFTSEKRKKTSDNDEGLEPLREMSKTTISGGQQVYQARQPQSPEDDQQKQPKRQFDVIAIGSGPGGYTAAIRCAQLGMSVAIVERDLIGGHAVNWGCVPLNAMIASARIVRTVRESNLYAIDIPAHRIEFPRIARRRDEAVKNVRQQVKSFLQKYNIQVYIGIAELLDEHRIMVRSVKKYPYANVYDSEGRSPYETDNFLPVQNNTVIYGKNIVISTGVDYEFPKFVETNDKKSVDTTHLLWNRTVPETLTIIGGGVLGCEIASLYSLLMSKVTLLEKNSRLLKIMDESVSLAVESRLKEFGVKVLLNVDVEKVSKGEVFYRNKQLDTTQTLTAHRVVICTGRKPSFDYDLLKKIGIAVDKENSRIVVEEDTCRTTKQNIYACGSVVSSCWSWIPCAIRQGHLVANAICKNRIIEYDRESQFQISINSAAPYVINVIPAVAGVGSVPEFEDDCLVFTFDFKSNRRAIIDGQLWGFVKMWVSKDEPKKLFAVQLVHESAAEIIEYYGMIISLNLSLHDVCLLPFAHPTYSESVKQACEYVLGRSIEYEGAYLN